MARRRANGVGALVDLGLTDLEAHVYSALVASSPATGYGVAKAIGKPAANTYTALAALERRGAVLLDDTRRRLYRAVPPDEWLAQLRRQFDERAAEARRALERLDRSQADDRIYSLPDVAQVYQRAREMLRRARTVALVDAFPMPLAAIHDEMEAAADRGVWIALKAYEPVKMPWCRVVVERPAIKAAWPAQWLNVAADAAEHLVALMREDAGEVVQAIWSASQPVSWVYHCGLAAEIFLTRMLAGEEPRATLRAFGGVPFAETPGRKALEARLRGGAPASARGRSAGGRAAKR
ncbi:MAG TPA: helix-turn-helix domain-containing protein [Kofleriaceae bacterium]|nr:helix-turn-helix domain-containing protein [Kofleriaceae bacterium]